MGKIYNRTLFFLRRIERHTWCIFYFSSVELLFAARLAKLEALAPLAHPLLLTGDIEADQHTALAFSADSHLKVILVTAWANRITV